MMRIEVLGTSFQIESDEDPVYVEKILQYYRDRVNEIERSVATGDPLKKAILAALLITDELFRSRNSGGPGGDEIERITNRLIQTIDTTLKQSD